MKKLIDVLGASLLGILIIAIILYITVSVLGIDDTSLTLLFLALYVILSAASYIVVRGTTKSYPWLKLPIILLSILAIIILEFNYKAFAEDPYAPLFVIVLVLLVMYIFSGYLPDIYPINKRLLKNEKVITFYNNTITAWANGKLNWIDLSFKKETNCSYSEFIKKYPPFKASILELFFIKYNPKQGEYLILQGDEDIGEKGIYFILTNLRLIIKDGITKLYNEIHLADVESFELSTDFSKSLKFKMKTGKSIIVNKVKLIPKNNILKHLINK